MCDDAHEHGALAGIELTHTEACTPAPARRARRPIGAVAARERLRAASASRRRWSKEDIARVRDDWVRAAELARDAGFDIVYVYGGHSYLPLQFLSPFYNRRTDEYGGSLENRARFWLETLEAVRAAVGRRLRHRRPLLRSRRSGRPASSSRRARVRLACRPPRRPLGRQRRLDPRLVEGLGLVAVTSRRAPSSSGRAGARGDREADRRRGAPDEPRPDGGDRLERRLGSDRRRAPSISDPFLPKKIEEGRYGEIRECIGCNICARRCRVRQPHRCTQNATVGEEYRRGWHPRALRASRERRPRRARRRRRARRAWSAPSFSASAACAASISSRRSRESAGHALGPASARTGGVGPRPQLAHGPAREARERRGDHRHATRRGRRARVRRGSWSSRPAHAGPATGSTTSRTLPIDGADASLPHVLTPEQVMLEGKVPPGERVIVFDCEGYYTGAGIAEKLAGDGFRSRSSRPSSASRRSATRRSRSCVRQHLHEVGVASGSARS